MSVTKIRMLPLKVPADVGKLMDLFHCLRYVIRQISCVLLSSKSFEMNDADVWNDGAYHVDKKNRDSDMWTSLRRESSEKYIVLIDFSQFHCNDKSSADRLIEAALTLVGYGHKFVVSLSSGVEMSRFTSNDRSLRDFLTNNSFKMSA